MEDDGAPKKAVTFNEEEIAEWDLTRGTRMKIDEAKTPFRRMSREESPQRLADSLSGVQMAGSGSSAAHWSARAEEGGSSGGSARSAAMADEGPSAAWEDRLASSLSGHHGVLPSALGHHHPHASHPHFSEGGPAAASGGSGFVPGVHDAERSSPEHVRFESARKAHYAGEARRILAAAAAVEDDEEEEDGDGDEAM